MSASKSKTNDAAGQNEVKRERKRPGLYDQNVPTFYVGAGNNPELYIYEKHFFSNSIIQIIKLF